MPSATDLVVALGAADRIVGISHECDHPAVTGRPVLTRATLTSAPAPGRAAANPALLDREVSRVRSAAQPLYRTDGAQLARLAPDAVIAQDVCDVCAVTGDQAACAVPPGTEVIRLGAVDLAGLAADLRTVAAALGGEAIAVADALVAAVESGLDDVRTALSGRIPVRVLLLEWGDPPFVAGHWVPELAAVAGGVAVLGAPGAPSRRVTWDQIATADPDAVVVLPCGYDLDAATTEARELIGRPEVASLRAVRAGRIWATDATRLFSRCTTVAVEAAETLAGLLHPGVVPAPSSGSARGLR